VGIVAASPRNGVRRAKQISGESGAIATPQIFFV
jgi:hypothetical protein